LKTEAAHSSETPIKIKSQKRVITIVTAVKGDFYEDKRAAFWELSTRIHGVTSRKIHVIIFVHIRSSMLPIR
jgi:hypothetical protein